MTRNTRACHILVCLTVLAVAGKALAAAGETAEAPPLWKSFYPTPRTEAQHVCLNEGWQLGHLDQPIEQPDEVEKVKEWAPVELPATIHWALYRAGKLPYPYAHLHSLKYEWIEKKAWYYRRQFQVPKDAADSYVFLCCDGIDYHGRFWLNGTLLGRHEGMSGGPAIEVSRLLRAGEPNELLIEVRSANALDPVFDEKGPRASNRTIKGWKLCGGVGAEPWFSVGIWQGVRLECVPRVHLERPFLSTRAANAEQAELELQVEVLAGTHSLEHSFRVGNNRHWRGSHRPWNAKQLTGKHTLEVEFINPEDGATCFQAEFPLELYEGRNWIKKDLVIKNPRLWWPNGLGEPDRYQVRLRLVQDGKPVDRIDFTFGIRTIERVRAAGPRTGDRWTDWQFVVNGRRLFVKGCNWMPSDVLLDLNPDRYRWLLESARDAGIQILRIWGGGHLETDDFYDVCDELGIMVWQDFPIGNRETPDWPQDVWESQVAWTVFRLRNRPSLAVWCGGNEFAPYTPGNSASIGILERTVAQLDGTRSFFRASPDEGSLHTYPDMDPTWYARLYRWIPYISETGMHSVAEARSLYEIVDAGEFKNLGQLWDKSFKQSHPEFLHHFVEYNPARVPRMLSRASHIDEMNDPSLESLAEGSQIGAAEFYQVLSESMQANYPVTAGLMPWVFKRPWPVVSGIMLLDGFGQPIAPYYFLKRTYEPTHVAVALPHLLWAPGENIPITAKVLHADEEQIDGLTIEVRILDDGFQLLWEQQAACPPVAAGPSVTVEELGEFPIPGDYKDRYLFVVAELRKANGERVSRSVYWPRSLTMLADEAVRRKFRDGPQPWPYFKDGPWLKPAVARTPTSLKVDLASHRNTSGEAIVELEIENTGPVPALPVTIDVDGIRRLFRASDNYFWLAPGERRRVTVVVRPREELAGKKVTLSVAAWNTTKSELSLPQPTKN